ncbi:MAG: site-specific integrase [Nitrospinae bacterium]|nr:site-specific integrase [Nitrospinota bacterium]
MLSKAFTLAYKRWEWMRENPCVKVQKEPEHNIIDRYLEPDEAERLIEKSRGYLNGQLGDIVITALHTGMRQGEILNLKWQDVDLFRKAITVKKTKNKEIRTVPMSDTLYELLKNRSKVVAMSGYVFATSMGTRILASNLQREFYNAMEKAGITGFRFHDLRHTAATWMVQSGVDLYTVSKILGHKDIRTTQRYAHHCPESLRKGVIAIDNFAKKTTELLGQKTLKNMAVSWQIISILER